MKDKYLGVLYNKFNDLPDNIVISKSTAEEQFNLTVPIDRLTAFATIRTFWREEWENLGHKTIDNTPTSEEWEFVSQRLLSGDNTKLSQNVAHVLPISFFEPEDYDYDLKYIRIPLKRLLDSHKFVLEVAGQTILFVESAQLPGTMIPFIYRSSNRTYTEPTPNVMYGHRFDAGVGHNDWSIIIVTPEYGSIVTATPIVTSSLHSSLYNTAVTRSFSGKSLIDYNAINAIIQGYIAEGDINIFGED